MKGQWLVWVEVERSWALLGASDATSFAPTSLKESVIVTLLTVKARRPQGDRVGLTHIWAEIYEMVRWTGGQVSAYGKG